MSKHNLEPQHRPQARLPGHDGQETDGGGGGRGRERRHSRQLDHGERQEHAAPVHPDQEDQDGLQVRHAGR